MLCAKQQECVGLEVDQAGIERCAARCFTNLEEKPALAHRVRAIVGCLTESCGQDYDRCTRHAELASRTRGTYGELGTAEALTTAECRVMCRKTFQCIGAPATGSAIDGCVLGCEAGRTPEDLLRYRAVIRCAAEPCGTRYRQCITTR